MNMNFSETNIETLHPFFRGGEQEGYGVQRDDICDILVNALKTVLYEKIQPQKISHKAVDKTYYDNASFWKDALSERHFPGAYINLDDFHLTEWLPFAPGRYFTEDAEWKRKDAMRQISPNRDEYLPNGKISMVQGGIGAIRLAEKDINGSMIYFLGASSTGISHQGIPIALPVDEYRKVIPVIKEHGGCRVKLIGTLQSLTEKMPSLYYSQNIPRYCFFVEEVHYQKPSSHDQLLTTVAAMFTTQGTRRNRGCFRNGDSDISEKSWTFCSFSPGSSKRNVNSAAEWLLDYAKRYSHGEPTILTDFDEHYRVFPCPVEFPISDIVRGTVDWESLHVYRNHYGDTYIENYIEHYEENNVAGDQITQTGNNNIIVNRSTIQNAFNKVKNEHDEDTAKALLRIEEEINKSGNKEAAENFESFSDELSKPEPKKSLLKTLWQGTLLALPGLKELTGVVEQIVKLFSV